VNDSPTVYLQRRNARETEIIGTESADTFIPQSVPEENRDLVGRNFCANFAFSRKIANFSQILPWRAIFAQICDLAERNFSQSSQILQFARNLREDI